MIHSTRSIKPSWIFKLSAFWYKCVSQANQKQKAGQAEDGSKNMFQRCWRSWQEIILEHDGVDDVRVLDREVERHTPGGRERVALDPVPGDPPELVPVVDDDDGHQRRDAGAERVAGEDEPVVVPAVPQQGPEGVGLAVEDPGGGLEEAVVDEPPVEHLHAEAVVEEDLVVAVADEVEAADGEDDLLVGAVGVDEVGRGAAGGLGVVDALGDGGGVEAVEGGGGGEAGAGEVVLVDGEDGSAEAGDGGEVVRGGHGGPGVGVVVADVGQALPRPARAAQAHHALQPARDRHWRWEKGAVLCFFLLIGMRRGGTASILLLLLFTFYCWLLRSR